MATKRERQLEQALHSLLNDIESMQNERIVRNLGYDNDNPSDAMPKDFFGPFTRYLDDDGMVEADFGVTIEWPNLRISMEAARKLLTGGK